MAEEAQLKYVMMVALAIAGVILLIALIGVFSGMGR